MEYPITESFGMLIDETDCGMDYRTRNCNYRQHEKKIIEDYCPCLKCTYLAKKILAVADIAIGYKGAVPTIFEVTHKNKISELKKEIYQTHSGFYLSVYEIEARHILGQIKTPKRLFVRQII